MGLHRTFPLCAARNYLALIVLATVWYGKKDSEGVCVYTKKITVTYGTFHGVALHINYSVVYTVLAPNIFINIILA